VKSFFCQCVGIDSADYWTPIEARHPDDAAEEYIKRCEEGSGGEMLNDPFKDRETVRVKNADGQVVSFEITMDWSKDYYVHEVGAMN